VLVEMSAPARPVPPRSNGANRPTTPLRGAAPALDNLPRVSMQSPPRTSMRVPPRQSMKSPPRTSMRTPQSAERNGAATPQRRTEEEIAHEYSMRESTAQREEDVDDLLHAVMYNTSMHDMSTEQEPIAGLSNGGRPPPMPAPSDRQARAGARRRANTAQWADAKVAYQSAGGTKSKDLSIDAVKTYLKTEGVDVDAKKAGVVSLPCFAMPGIL
jgi:hypothetical protein